eukprot:GHVU01219135.1.p1 GENE.GHVU01219135.1~~GHVU01219135.1.p1  ORF type:complete len:522 (+),score=31.08 GHVU01219135.1:1335-2900(+)
MARVSLIIILSALLVAGGEAATARKDSWITDKRIVPDGQTVGEFRTIFGQIEGCFSQNKKRMSKTAPTVVSILEGGPTKADGQLTKSQLEKARAAVSQCQRAQPQYLRDAIITSIWLESEVSIGEMEKTFGVKKQYFYPEESDARTMLLPNLVDPNKTLDVAESIEVAEDWLLSLVNVLTDSDVLKKYDGRPIQISPLSLNLDALRARYRAAIEYLRSADSTSLPDHSVWRRYAGLVIDPPSLKGKITGTESGYRKSSPGEIPTREGDVNDPVRHPLRLVEYLVPNTMNFNLYEQLCRDLTSAKCKVQETKLKKNYLHMDPIPNLLTSARANIWKCTSLKNKDGDYARVPANYGKEQFIEVMGKAMIAAPLCQLPESDDGFRDAWDCLVTVVHLKDPHFWLQNIGEDQLQSLVDNTLKITNVQPWWELKEKLSITKGEVLSDEVSEEVESPERVYPDVSSQMQATSLVFRLMKVLNEPSDLANTYKNAIKHAIQAKLQQAKAKLWEADKKTFMDPLTLKRQ